VACEKVGIPAVTLVCEVRQSGETTSRELGFPGLRWACCRGIPAPSRGKVRQRAAGTLQQVIDGLVR
jgi:hypothetical protein